MKQFRKLTLVALVITLTVVAISLQGCGKSDKADKPQISYITIKGSDTMVHLVSSWAEYYMKAHPNVEISVTGGGSGTGVAALLNGTTDICAASRDMKGKEYKLAQDKGMTPKEFSVARDGLAVVMHKYNPVKALTMEQLMKLFTGAVTNWKQLGGPDQPILILSRESNSGTYVFFQEHVLKKKDYAASARLMPASSSIIQSVENDKWAIGYVGLGYATEAGDKIQILAVKKDDAAQAILPSNATVSSGDYPIARPLHLYTSGEPVGAVKAFIDFCYTPEGQKIVTDTGYIGVK